MTQPFYPWLMLNQRKLKGEVSLYHWPPVWLVWNHLYGNWQFWFLFAKQNNPNQSNRRSTVQWYFPLQYSLVKPMPNDLVHALLSQCTLAVHRHLRKIYWLMAHTACLVCLVIAVSGRSKNALGRGSASSGHITNLEQSRFSFDIYVAISLCVHATISLMHIHTRFLCNFCL